MFLMNKIGDKTVTLKAKILPALILLTLGISIIWVSVQMYNVGKSAKEISRLIGRVNNKTSNMEIWQNLRRARNNGCEDEMIAMGDIF